MFFLFQKKPLGFYPFLCWKAALESSVLPTFISSLESEDLNLPPEGRPCLKFISLGGGIGGKKKETNTPPKINIKPENDGLVQMIFLFPGGPYSQVPAVSLRGCKKKRNENNKDDNTNREKTQKHKNSLHPLKQFTPFFW